MTPETEQTPARSYTSWLVVPVVAAAIWLALRSSNMRDEVATPFAVAPFTLQPLVDAPAPITLDDLRGKVTIVNFWATWCGPCVSEFPEFIELTKHYASQSDFRMLSVATDHLMPDRLRSVVATFLRQRGWKLPVYADPDGKARSALSGPAPTDRIPVTLLIGRDAQVVKVIVGNKPPQFDELKLQIATLLRK